MQPRWSQDRQGGLQSCCCYVSCALLTSLKGCQRCCSVQHVHGCELLAMLLPGALPESSLATGYSSQQAGIWSDS